MKTKFFVCSVIIGIAAAAMLLPQDAALQTSQNNDKLKKAFEQYPDADVDGDGILTMKEAEAFRSTMKTKGAKGGKNAAQTPAIPLTAANVKYGTHERQVFDFWKAKSSTPAPVLLCIHGHGFVGGDKSIYYNDPLVKQCLDAGISVATMSYRYVTTDPFPAPMLDGARVVQYLRSKAEAWNIDPKRIGATGSSAGANLSVWLATHDDFADPNAKDPVARESTRLSFVLAYKAQTFNDLEMVRKHIYNGTTLFPSTLAFFGVASEAELTSDKVKKLGHEASAINFVSKDDPPIFFDYEKNDLSATPLPEGTGPGGFIHHPKFGELFKKEYDALGIECHFYYSSKPAPKNAAFDFILRSFGMKR